MMSLRYLIILLLVSFCRTGAAATVVVDVGHYPSKPGATSARGVPEFEFNEALANVVSKTLTDGSARQVLRLGDGKIADLRQRTALAKAMNADLIVSLHHDSVHARFLEEWSWNGVKRLHSEKAAGFSLFVSNKNPALQQSLACASGIGAALRKRGFQINTQHADAISGENRAWADRENGIYYYDDLLILKTAAMPSLLLEAGVIVNREEELRVQQPETRAAIAEAVREGLSTCGY